MPDIFSFTSCFMTRSKSSKFDSLRIEFASFREAKVDAILFAHELKSFSNFAFTAASILISGGQGRLKPSPGNFFVASLPSLLPLAISLVAWPSPSDGPLVKMLSRCGSVLAQRRKRTSLVLHRVGLADAHEDEVAEDVFGPV